MAATIIDALVVELGLDPTKFKKGQQEAGEAVKKTEEDLTKSGKNIEAGAGNMLEGFSKLRNQVLGFGAALLGAAGVKEFVQNVVHTGVEMGKFARTTGISVETLSEWRNVADQTGGSAGAVTGTIKNLTQAVAQWQLTGESAAIPYLRSLNLDIRDFIDSNGAIKVTELLLAIAGAREKLHLDAPRFAAIAGALGIDEATIALMIRGRAEMQARIDKQKQLGHVTEEDRKAQEDLNTAWEESANAAIALGRSILTGAIPGLIVMLHIVSEIAAVLGKLPQWWINLIQKKFPNTPEGVGSEWVPGLTPSAGAPSGGIDIQALTKSSRVGGGTGATGGSDLDKLVAMGWTREQALGILANVQAESKGRINATGDQGQAYGLAQWHPDRQRNFAAWAGHDIRQSTRDEQLAFINYELRQGTEQAAGRALSQTTNAGQAASVLSSQYERPQDVIGAASARSALATSMARSGNTSTTTIHDDKIEVNAGQGDPDTIAKGVRAALDRTSLAAQSNYGQQ